MQPAPHRQLRGARSAAAGRSAEDAAVAALAADGWTILGRRVRTPAGELDAIAEKAGLLAFIEVKSRPTLGEAAAAIGQRQVARIFAAAEWWAAANPGHGAAGMRFDALLVDAGGAVRRIADAHRLGMG